MDCSSSGVGSAGPVVTKSSPDFMVPVIDWSTLFQVTVLTLPSATCSVKVENAICFCWAEFSDRALTTVSPTTATSTHSSHDGRPLGRALPGGVGASLGSGGIPSA